METADDIIHIVALLAKGVDRNNMKSGKLMRLMSPSSQRAWIEITSRINSEFQECVALLAEGVDRNLHLQYTWTRSANVALLAEGVDRNGKEVDDMTEAEVSPSSQRAWIEMI